MVDFYSKKLLYTAWTVKFVHMERPQWNGPGAVPSTTGAVPPLFYTIAILLHFLLDMAFNNGPRGRSTSTILLYWAPGPFHLSFIILHFFLDIMGPRAIPTTKWGRSTSTTLLYWAPGPFHLHSGAVPPLFYSTALLA